MADIKIERTELAVTFTAAAYRDLPPYRDTLHVDPSSTREEWVAEAKKRHRAWADSVRHPPEPEPVEPPSKDEALAQARDALTAALDAVNTAAEPPAETG